MNWKGQPLVDYETVVQLIGAVKTSTRLKVKSQLDLNIYEKGKKYPTKNQNQSIFTSMSFMENGITR
jgi:hypothetical protein